MDTGVTGQHTDKNHKKNQNCFSFESYASHSALLAVVGIATGSWPVLCMAMDIIAHPLKEEKRVTVIEALFWSTWKVASAQLPLPAKTLTEVERMAEEGKNEVTDRHSHVEISHGSVYGVFVYKQTQHNRKR